MLEIWYNYYGDDMTKYYYTCEQDRNLNAKSFDNIAFIIFGKNNTFKIEAFKEIFQRIVSEINVYPQGTITRWINNSTPGICREENEKLIIEMWGYALASREMYSFIKHEATHEFCHGFIDVLQQLSAKKKNGVVRDNILYSNHMGMIKESAVRTGKLVNQHYYGKMYNETMMDIITSMSINAFDSNHPSNIDEILKSDYTKWGNAVTGYSIFTSITRLTIAAFSNNANVCYQNLVDNGFGIFDGSTKMKNGEKYKINDFLYGIVFDHLHIEEEFDKFMGTGNYRIFAEYLDRLFISFLGKKRLPSDEIIKIMNILPDFLNRKMAFYKRHGIIDENGATKIIENFNQIWNSMQKEYRAYFSRQDIDEIARRTGM